MKQTQTQYEKLKFRVGLVTLTLGVVLILPTIYSDYMPGFLYAGAMCMLGFWLLDL